MDANPLTTTNRTFYFNLVIIEVRGQQEFFRFLYKSDFVFFNSFIIEGFLNCSSLVKTIPKAIKTANLQLIYCLILIAGHSESEN